MGFEPLSGERDRIDRAPVFPLGPDRTSVLLPGQRGSDQGRASILIERTAHHRRLRPKKYARIDRALIRVLSARDRERKISLYAARVETGLPLFG
jgi:hypothetical protein